LALSLEPQSQDSGNVGTLEACVVDLRSTRLSWPNKFPVI